MTNEQIKEKYGIEPIMKEMWVWDNHPKDACLLLVIYKSPGCDYHYQCIDKVGYKDLFYYASETNPNEPKEPKVGDVGYFWNEFKVFYTYGLLMGINNKVQLPYICEDLSSHSHFSHDKQPWMQ